MDDKEIIKDLKKNDPWLNHIPFPRVLEIITDCVSSKENQNVVDFTSPLAMQDLPFLNNPQARAKIVESMEREEPIDNYVIVYIYTEIPSIFEKHLLECFHNFSELSISELDHLITSTFKLEEDLLVKYLGHKCNEKNETNILNRKKSYLSGAINSSEELYKKYLNVTKHFLEKCCYSLTSIKVVNIFHSLNIFHEKELVYNSEYFELLCLISEPPCLQCNKIINTEIDLEFLSKEISKMLTNLHHSNIDFVKVILCIHCEWMAQLKESVRMFFLNDIICI